MSTFRVEVVPVTLEKHPNADALSVVRVWNYTCCVRSADFAGIATGAYVPPDSLVDPTRPEFAFLKDKAKGYTDGLLRARIRVAKLRGVVSQGLLVIGKPHWTVGQDVADELGVTHYDPPIQTWGLGAATDAEAACAPLRNVPVYDVENWRRYAALFTVGETVWVTEKIHGANARFAWREDRMWCGSRTGWKADDPRSPWWQALRRHPEVEAFCRAHPDLVVYGEIYGQVQDLRYGATKDDPIRIAVFDLLRGNEWLAPDIARKVGAMLPWVPMIASVAYDPAAVEAMAEGPSLMPGATHVREGCVVKPVAERTHLELGRVQLKVIGNGYMERA